MSLPLPLARAARVLRECSVELLALAGLLVWLLILATGFALFFRAVGFPPVSP